MWINPSQTTMKLKFPIVQTNNKLRFCVLHRVKIDYDMLTLSYRVRMKYKKTISRCSLIFHINNLCDNINYKYEEPYKWNGKNFISVIHHYDFSTHSFSKQDEIVGIKHRHVFE